MSERIYRSSYPPITVPTDLSIFQFFELYNPDDVIQDKVILQEFERPERKLTYGGARRQAALGAAALQNGLGLCSGDTILIIGSNTLDWITTAHAAMWAGITVAAASPFASAHEYVYYIGVTNPKIVFCDPGTLMETVKKAYSLFSAGQSKPHLLGLGERGTAERAFPQDFVPDVKDPLPCFDLGGKDNRTVPAAIVFSSGTSGRPKAVQESHHNLIAHMLGPRVGTPENFSSTQREVFFAPMGHIYGVLTALLVPVFAGSQTILLRKYLFQDYIKAAVSVRATFLRLVPPTATAMAKDPWVAKQDLSSVQTIQCAGAVLAPEIIGALEKMLKGVDIIQGYGLSEGGGATLKPFSAKRKAGSVGKLLPSTEARLVDDDLHDVPPGQPGEILLRGPSMFMGYKDNQEANYEAFPYGIGNWMRTGDVGRFDDEGFLYLTDRKKDLVKFKGNQVPPAELEDVLLSHPLVTEAGVCASWDDQQGTEVPTAYVNLAPTLSEGDRSKTLAEIRRYHDERVAGYKKLRGGIFYLPVLPRSPTGKLLRRELPARKALDAKQKAEKAKL
ncbi:acyl-CoA synthetases/AMP-acid ligases II [Cadophora sp. MPI-SDFR-AT-0126]|nr:acyl-CoA synthetases/AMP-acid ligases II [Leotiomycetes sp. MPI-SDFR-AT-0126]